MPDGTSGGATGGTTGGTADLKAQAKVHAKRFLQWARLALATVFDQTKPFGRLATVHSLMSAGVTALTVGLAGTLFFSISPGAAEGKVLLYLLLTIAPFAVVAPVLSPLLDKGRQARRTAVTISALGSALLCVAMAMNVNSLLLFPEAFGILVLSKLYMVTRAAIVPAVVAPGDDLASANARLAVLAGIAGFAVSPIAVAFLQAGASEVLILAAIVFAAATIAALRLPRTAKDTSRPVEPVEGAPGSYAGAGYGHQGVAPSGPAPKPPGPGAGLVNRPPYQYESRQGAGAAAATGGADPLGAGSYGPPPPALAAAGGGHGGTTQGAGQRGRFPGGIFGKISPRLAIHSPEVTLGLAGVSTLRAAVGFVTFFLAFALKRQVPPAATWLYGVIVLASGIGGLSGSLSVPWLRRHLSEERIIMLSLVVAAGFAGLTAFIGGLWAQPLLTAVIALTATTSKPSFDSIAQRHTPPLQQGRAFAQFETRLQLIWVMAAVTAVVIDFSFVGGDIVIAVGCAVSAIFYGSVSQSIRRHDPVSHAEEHVDGGFRYVQPSPGGGVPGNV
jgi:hypothetical protein